MKPLDPEKVVYAPYNFVPLARSVYQPSWGTKASQDRPFRDGISGSIPLTIEARTPLLVGGKRLRKDGAPVEMEFVAEPGSNTPFIPGSSLRGLIRSVVEIAGFGRMRYVDDRHFAFRDLSSGMKEAYGKRMSKTGQEGSQRTYEPKVSSGWLRFGPQGWAIIPCEFSRIELSELLGNFKHRTPYNASVKYKKFGFPGRSLDGLFEMEPRRTHSHSQALVYSKAVSAQAGSKTAKPGTIVFTGQPNDPDRRGSKHMEFVFHSARPAELQVSEEVMSAFRIIHAADSQRADVRGSANRLSDDDIDTWTFWTRHQNDGHGIPVFYLTDANGDVESLGLSMMYKLPYRASVHDILRRHGAGRDEYGPHLDDRVLDLADSLFGYVRDGKESPGASNEAIALKGRISFDHAKLNGPKRTTRQPAAILSAPKPSYLPNYIVQPEADANGQLPDRAKYASYENDGGDDRGTAELRGWKRYPVRPRAIAQQIPEPLVDQKAVQSVLQSLDVGSRFGGTLRLHNVRPIELGALLFALRLSTDWASDHPERWHSLGLGKPFGFGAVVFDIGVTAENWGKADLIANDPDAPLPSPEDCLKAFVVEMNTFCRTMSDKSDWALTPQIRALLAMADPSLAEGGTLDMRCSGERVTTERGKRGASTTRDTASSQSVFYGPAHPLASMPLQDFAGRKNPPRSLPSYDGEILPRPPKAPPRPPQKAGASQTRVMPQGPLRPADRDRRGFRFLAGDAVLFNGDPCTMERDVSEQAYSYNAKVDVREGGEVFPVPAKSLVAVKK